MCTWMLKYAQIYCSNHNLAQFLSCFYKLFVLITFMVGEVGLYIAGDSYDLLKVAEFSMMCKWLQLIQY